MALSWGIICYKRQFIMSIMLFAHSARLLVQSDHEKHLQRAKDARKAAQQSSSSSFNQTPSGVGADVANMYQSRDLSLKEGETIKINIKRPGSGGSRQAAESTTGSRSFLPPASLAPSPAKTGPKQASHKHSAASSICNPCLPAGGTLSGYAFCRIWFASWCVSQRGLL